MRCVVADDSSIVRDRVKAYLQSSGHQVVGMAHHGKQGYEMCVQHRPEIVIFDVSMPIMNGDVAALKVKQENLAKFVIIASSQVQVATLEPLISAGCFFISKPFAKDKFTIAIEKILSMNQGFSGVVL